MSAAGSNTEPMRNVLLGFKTFLFRGNVVDLAVAVVIGAAFSTLIKALVNDVITPIIAAIIGQARFGGLLFTIHRAVFGYGDLLDATITFVSIAAAVYFFIVAPVDALMARRHQEDPTTKPCPECTSAIPLRARRCPMCTAQIAGETTV
jgi:large conductance mechanosensitive channel